MEKKIKTVKKKSETMLLREKLNQKEIDISYLQSSNLLYEENLQASKDRIKELETKIGDLNNKIRELQIFC